MRKEWKAKLSTLQRELTEHAFFVHPESIIALRYLGKRNANGYIYEGMVRKRKKGIPLTYGLNEHWVKQNFDKKYIESVEELFHNGQHVWFTDFEKNPTEEAAQLAEKEIVDDDDMAGISFEKQMSGDTGLMLITAIRVTCKFDEQGSVVGEEQWEILSMSYDGKTAPSRVSTRTSTKEWKQVDKDFIKNENCIGKKITKSLLEQAQRNYKNGNPNDPTGSAEKTIDVKKDIFTYKLGMCQLCSLMYDNAKKCYKGRYYTDIEGPAKQKKTATTTLTTDWVKDNFSKEFIASIQAIANKKKRFLYVPPGKARPSKKCKTEEQTNLDCASPIAYPQENRPTCVTSSLASCMRQLGYLVFARLIENYGREFIKDHTKNQSKSVNYLVTHLRNNVPDFANVWIHKPLPSDYDIWKDRKPQQPKLIQIHGSDGAVNHAVTIWNNLIFDSNLDHAVPLNRKNLEDCCDAVYQGILLGFVFVRAPPKQINAQCYIKQNRKNRKKNKKIKK